MAYRPLLLAGLLVLPLAATADEKLNIKLGLWEITSVVHMTGVPELPPDLLAKMSPQQRAQMEAAFKAEAAKGPKKDVSKECLTQKDLDHPFDADKDCKTSTATGTRTTREMHLVCTGDNRGTGTLRINAPTPESMSGDMDLKSGNGQFTIKAQLKGRWIGPDCGDEDDEDSADDESEDTDEG